MAFTQSPETNTYASPTLPVAFGIDFRSGTQVDTPSTRRDAGVINLVPRKYLNPYTGQQETQLETRAAIDAVTAFSVPADPAIRGLFLWEYDSDTSAVFVVVNQNVYINTGSGWNIQTTLITNVTTPVGFTEFIDSSTNAKSLILVDGVQGLKYTIAAGVVTEASLGGAGFPNPHVPFPVFLDGYLFLAKKKTGDIYNSDLNTPTNFTAGSFISSELYPDDIQALVKVNNYLLAIGTEGSEYFYDAANATASPLARYEGGSLPFGTNLPYTIASDKNQVFLVANSNDGEGSLKVIEGFRHKDITPHWIIPYISTALSILPLGSDHKVRGSLMRMYGEAYYTLRVASTTQAADYGYFAYHITSDFWSEFTGQNYASFPVYATSPSITNVLATYVFGYTGTTAFYGTYGPGGLGASAGVDHLNGDTISYNIPVEVRTSRYDYGTPNVKTMSRFGVYGVALAYAESAMMSVYYCDDDFTWVQAGTSDMKGTVDFPFVTQLGMFRYRAMKVTYTGDSSIQLRSFNVDINRGQQ